VVVPKLSKLSTASEPIDILVLYFMAKDSDKLTLLKRRKVELDHAIRQRFDTDAIERRVEKLRLAALAVAKKYRGDFGHLRLVGRDICYTQGLLLYLAPSFVGKLESPLG